jgi:hypothetical protein
MMEILEGLNFPLGFPLQREALPAEAESPAESPGC